MTQSSAIVIGGGIGGLAAAIALRQAGVDATVYERAPELGEAGAGITLASNAMRALETLGLAERVRNLGHPVQAGTIKRWDGQVIVNSPPGAGRFLSLCIHRADLQRALTEALGIQHLVPGREFTRLEEHDGSVTAVFADGSSVSGSFLVGADGMQSKVRAGFHGEHRPHYAGYTVWRCVTGFDAGPWVSESWGSGRRFGIVPIGRGRVYWFATKNAPEGRPDPPTGRRNELLELFKGWHEPVEAIIRATEDSATLRHDIYDRAPLRPPWGRGRVTLLGDAAHPMTPNLGQGACQAIEDAILLAYHVRHATAVRPGPQQAIAFALRSYESDRAPRTASIARLSRRFGAVSQLESPLLRRARDAIIRALPAGFQARQMAKVVAFEPPDIAT